MASGVQVTFANRMTVRFHSEINNAEKFQIISGTRNMFIVVRSSKGDVSCEINTYIQNKKIDK